MYVVIEETRSKEIWVDADDFDEAIGVAEELYVDGQIDMRDATEVHALVGDEENDFIEIAEWYC